MATRVKKQYEVLNNTKKKIDSINIDGREVKLNPMNGKGIVTDPGLAKEIDARLGAKSKEITGRQMMVVEVDDLDPKQDKGFPTYHTLPRALKYKTIAEREAAKADRI